MLLLIAYTALVVFITYYVVRTHRKLNNITSTTHVVSITLLALVFFNIVAYNFENFNNLDDKGDDLIISGDNLKDLPDIYYIVLDEYAPLRTLDTFYGYDNTDFVEERRKLLSAAETKALTDELTKLPNRRSFNEKIAEELERFNRYGTVFSLIMLDIDEFKAVNDAFGHGSGDQVLIALARKMKESVRALDLVSRIGGEEFTILLAETGIDGAKQRAELLREMVEDMVVKTDQGDIDITISLGVVSVRDGDTAKSMLYDVDSAMYQATQGGRNQAVVLW